MEARTWIPFTFRIRLASLIQTMCTTCEYTFIMASLILLIYGKLCRSFVPYLPSFKQVRKIIFVSMSGLSYGFLLHFLFFLLSRLIPFINLSFAAEFNIFLFLCREEFLFPLSTHTINLEARKTGMDNLFFQWWT